MKIPRTPPRFSELIEALGKDAERSRKVFTTGFEPLQDGKYRHWQTLGFMKPPGDLSHKEWWTGIKLARMLMLKDLPLLDTQGHPFRFATPDPALEMVHLTDRDASGKIEISEQVTNPATRDRYLVSSLIEEAITSSQLEGAATTHRVAKEMIRSGRQPRNRSEQMIFNNYAAMRRIRELKGLKLTPEVVIELHRIVTEDTLDSSEAAGRLRVPEDEVKVWDQRDGTILHVPPDAKKLPKRLEAMCDFANGKTPSFFIHPVIRAITLHFWLAYDHPFVDGNGRTARALFYWSMLTQGYWLSEYISISRVVKNAPARYVRAFLYTETDDNDLTYFILYHLRVIRLAIQHLHAYLQKKMGQLRETEHLLKRSEDFNYRQLALLSHALRHPEARYSIQTHRTSHNVVYQTARTDLLDLVRRRLLMMRRIGRTFYFSPTNNLERRLGKRPPSRPKALAFDVKSSE